MLYTFKYFEAPLEMTDQLADVSLSFQVAATFRRDGTCRHSWSCSSTVRNVMTLIKKLSTPASKNYFQLVKPSSKRPNPTL